ncbi:hypothetical protein Bca101_040637 [Brassica carinata]
MRNFDYGSDGGSRVEKGGERDASDIDVGIYRGVGVEDKAGTSYGSLRHLGEDHEEELHMGRHLGEGHGRGSTLSLEFEEAKVNVAPSGDDREEWPETEMLALTVAKKIRRGTSYGGSPVSPRQSKKQKVNSERSLGDDGDDREEFLQIEEFGDIGDDGREDENGIAGIEEVGCTDLSLYFGDKAKNDDCEVDEDEGDDDAWDDDKIPILCHR